MKHILFFDIDGTLRDEVYGVPETAKTAVRLCRDRGHLICLCTGRTYSTIPDDVRSLEVDGVIAGGGSYIRFGDQVLQDRWLPGETIRKAFDYLKQLDDHTAFTLEGQNEIFMNRQAVTLLQQSNEKKWSCLTPQQKVLAAHAQNITYQENLHLFPTGESDPPQVSKICLWSTQSAFETLKRIMGTDTIQLAQKFPTEHGRYFEIIQAGCSKGQALSLLCDSLGIPLEHVIAFGDGKNDIDMFRAAGTSVAVQSGDSEVERYADSVCGKPLQDGIFKELKRRRII